MNFDESSKAWRENKINNGNGSFSYRCKVCLRACLVYSKNNKNKFGVSDFCKKHQQKKQKQILKA